MKRVLSLVLALVLVLGMIPTFAAEMTAGQHLFEHEFIAGDENGNLMEDQLLTREQLAKLVLELNGSKEEADALTLPPSFTDAAKISTWARPYVAFAQIEGLFKGYTDGSFRPQTGVTGQVLAQVLTRALGYEFAWETVVADAADLGIEVATGAALTRGQAFEAMWVTVNTNPKGEEITLGQKLGKIDLPEPEAPAALAVVSVKALNLKQIEVTFNKDAEADVDNILINGSAVDEDYFIVSEDGTVVTLYLDSTPVAGTIKKVSVTGLEGLATAHYDVRMNDSQLPEIKSVESVGNTLVRVTFTEPMNSGLSSMANFRINNTVKSGTMSLNDTRTVLSITLSTGLANGTYKLAVDPANVKDFAGNAIGVNETEFEVVKETATPTFTVVSASQEVVKVQFEREPKSVAKIYWKNGASKVESGTGVQNAVDPTIFTFTFDAANRLANGDNTVYMAEVKDFSGNTTKDKEFTVTATVDVTRPEFLGYVQKSQSVFELKFSKAITLPTDSATTGYVTVTDSKNVAVTETVTYKTNPSLDKTTLVMTFSSPSSAARSPYTVKLQDVVDTTYLKNKMTDVTFTIAVDDKTAPVVSSVYRSGQVISVVFSEAVQGVDASNFMYLYGGDYYALPAAAYLTLVGNDVVNITFPTNFGPSNNHTIGGITTAAGLYINGVKDLAGNALVATTKNIDTALASVAIVGSPMAHDAKTIYVKVDKTTGTLVNVWEGDFVVKAGSTTLTVTKAELVVADSDVNKLSATGTGHDLGFTTNDQIIKLTLDESLRADGKYMVSGTPTAVTVATASTVEVTKTALGAPLAVTTQTVVDKIIPAAPVAGNFTLTKDVTNAALDITTSYIADETVEVEYLVQDNDVTEVTLATSPLAGSNLAAASVYNAATTTPDVNNAALDTAAGGTVAAGQEVYVRHLDTTTGNFSAWVKIGTITPNTTAATFVFTAGSTTAGQLANITTAEEYSIDGGSTWTTATGTTAALSGVTDTNDVKVRTKAVGTVPASATQTIDITAQPAAPAIVITEGAATGQAVLNGSTTAMEYRVDLAGDGTWNVNWTAVGSANLQIGSLTAAGGDIIQVRVAATAASASIATPEGLSYQTTLIDAQVKD